MPIIYLKHPVHGTKVATMEAEANADVANGWKVYNPEEQPQVAEAVKNVNVLAEVAEVAEVAPPVEVKRRRKV